MNRFKFGELKHLSNQKNSNQIGMLLVAASECNKYGLLHHNCETRQSKFLGANSVEITLMVV